MANRFVQIFCSSAGPKSRLRSFTSSIWDLIEITDDNPKMIGSMASTSIYSIEPGPNARACFGVTVDSVEKPRRGS